MGHAIELAVGEMEKESTRLVKLRDAMIKSIMDNIDDVVLNGHPNKRLSNNVNVSIKFVEGEALLLSLDMLGIGSSSGSACTSGSLDPSHVLLAIGLPHEIAHGSLRFSLGHMNDIEDVNYVVDKLKTIVERLRMMSPLG